MSWSFLAGVDPSLTSAHSLWMLLSIHSSAPLRRNTAAKLAINLVIKCVIEPQLMSNPRGGSKGTRQEATAVGSYSGAGGKFEMGTRQMSG